MAFYSVKYKVYPDGTLQLLCSSSTCSLFGANFSAGRKYFFDQSKKELDHQKRARQTVYDLARSNHFSYFLTLTFDPEKVYSLDYDSCVIELRKFTRKLTESNCSYIFVPEQHKSGRWHFHGLVQGDLRLSPALRQDGSVISNLYYASDYKIGYNTVSFIKDEKRCATYITKYLTKTMSVPAGRKRYWCSNGLIRPVELDFGDLISDSDLNEMKYDYKKEFSNAYGKFALYEFHSSNVNIDNGLNTGYGFRLPFVCR